MRRTVIASMLLCLMALPANAQARVKDLISEISIEEEGDEIRIRALFSNQSDTLTTLKYQLQTTKGRRSGKSASSQSGAFCAEPGEEVTLSTIKHHWQAGDMYRIRLITYRENQIYINNIKTIKR